MSSSTIRERSRGGGESTARDALIRATAQIMLEEGYAAVGALLRDLDTQLLGLETMIAASLPHAADSFDDTMLALAEVHRHRDALKAAAQKAG